MLLAMLTTVGTGVRSFVPQCRAMSSTEYILKRSNLWNTSSYIGGKWITGSTNLGTFEVCNPATGLVIANCSRMTAEDVVIAADISNEAWKSWRKTLSVDRARILRRMSELMKENSDDLAYIITIESGKPYSEAKGEINYARSFFDYYAEEATRIKGEMMENSMHGQKMITLKQSVGPAALITPWNFPSASKTLIQQNSFLSWAERLFDSRQFLEF
jgi:succinate-semialdehyde dehydrogenase / glutarate-semialdehyde dehydrogenase